MPITPGPGDKDFARADAIRRMAREGVEWVLGIVLGLAWSIPFLCICIGWVLIYPILWCLVQACELLMPGLLRELSDDLKARAARRSGCYSDETE